jgi:hypothetical protein
MRCKSTRAHGLGQQSQLVSAKPSYHREVSIADRPSVSSFLQYPKDIFGGLDGIANFAGIAGHMLGHQEIWEIDEK